MKTPLTLLLLDAAGTFAFPHNRDSSSHQFHLKKPASGGSVSIEHSPDFPSISIDPAFWVEFAGTAAEPNELFIKLISHMTDRGSRPIIRPGGITQDGLIFDPEGGDPVRTMGPDGEIYRTTVGPAYYESWSNFPDEVKFVSTLNFANNSLEIAEGLASASAKYQADNIAYFELGNEPNHFPEERWDYETSQYVNQWKEWTTSIDEAVDEALQDPEQIGQRRWWASSATTDPSELKIRPADVIPAGIDSDGQVGQYSIHSYVYNTCSPEGAAEATIENILNHTQITTFADEEVTPSAQAAIKNGSTWVMGEFNSVACSGKQNVSDTFMQSLWVIDTYLTYATMNASSVNLHQGGTLVLQSGDQTNTPGFSSYNFLYPRDSEKFGEARVLPSFTAQLFMAEVFSQDKVRFSTLDAPSGVDADRFSGYAAYEGDEINKLILLNMNPYYADSEDDYSLNIDVSDFVSKKASACVKRLTAPAVDEKDASRVTWAGQSFKQGDASGEVEIEKLKKGHTVKIRGSEAVLVYLNDKSTCEH